MGKNALTCSATEFMQMAPLFNKPGGELCHLTDTGAELIIKTLSYQYKNEHELNALLGLIITFENLELM